jgi:hypothetical protein
MLNLATKFVPRRESIETAYLAGFRHAEWWLNATLLADWESLAELGTQYPFSYVLHFPNRLEQEPKTLRQAASLYRRLGCQAMVIHQPHFDRYAAAFAEIDSGLNLAVENHRLSPGGIRTLGRGIARPDFGRGTLLEVHAQRRSAGNRAQEVASIPGFPRRQTQARALAGICAGLR